VTAEGIRRTEHAEAWSMKGWLPRTSSASCVIDVCMGPADLGLGGVFPGVVNTKSARQVGVQCNKWGFRLTCGWKDDAVRRRSKRNDRISMLVVSLIFSIRLFLPPSFLQNGR
jgi:hypothetical protein